MFSGERSVAKTTQTTLTQGKVASSARFSCYCFKKHYKQRRQLVVYAWKVMTFFRGEASSDIQGEGERVINFIVIVTRP